MRPKHESELGHSAIRAILLAPSVFFLVTTLQAAPQDSVMIEQNGYFRMGESADGIEMAVPSIDASGITYHAPSGHLFIVDSEINEVPEVWDQVQANLFEVSLDGKTLFSSHDLENPEPTGITYNEFDGRFYVTNDNADRLYRYSYKGGVFKKIDSVSTRPDSLEPQGVTSDPAGNIYVLDGAERKVLVYTYQAGQFSLPSTINLATCPSLPSSRVERHQAPASDVKGIAFDPPTGHLFVVEETDQVLHEYDQDGNCLADFDVSVLSPRPIALKGLDRGPASAGGPSQVLYFADARIDSSLSSDEREALVYEGEIVPAPPGEALHFNGVRDHLQVSSAPDLYPDALTVSAWIRPALLGADDYILSTKYNGGYSLGIDIQNGATNPGVLSSRCRVDGTYYNVYGATPLVLEQWAHVAMTYDGVDFRLYLNGAEDGSLPAAGTLDASPGDLFIGAESDDDNAAYFTFFAGRIDEVTLWNVALTPGEVASSCSLDSSALPAPGNVIAHWRFEDVTDGMTPDETGLHDAVVNGASHVEPGPGSSSVAFRNAVPNPSSYTASDPALGSTWTTEVDLTTTGHSFAQVVGFTSPANVVLRRGQVLLVGGAKLFQLPAKPGPIASWSVPVPSDCALLGLAVYTQAVHLLGVKPFALSNAQDLVLGY